MLLFLLFHILDTALILVGPELYNRVIAIYRLPLFGLAEIGLFAAVLFHSLNGIRITIVDFWPAATQYHKILFGVVVVLFLLVFVPVAGIMLGHILHASG